VRTLVKRPKASFNMRMISADSLLTMVRRSLSHSAGTLTRPV
jgi:hypothetical protein